AHTENGWINFDVYAQTERYFGIWATPRRFVHGIWTQDNEGVSPITAAPPLIWKLADGRPGVKDIRGTRYAQFLAALCQTRLGWALGCSVWGGRLITAQAPPK